MRVRALDGEVLLVSMLDRREQALHEAEFESLLGELRATLESAADAILVCDPDGRIRAFNHRFATLWGIRGAAGAPQRRGHPRSPDRPGARCTIPTRSS